jgi:hypothetical protein
MCDTQFIRKELNNKSIGILKQIYVESVFDKDSAIEQLVNRLKFMELEEVNLILDDEAYNEDWL